MEFIHTDRPLSWFRRNRYAAFSDNDQPPIRQRRGGKQVGFAFHHPSSIDRLAHESGLSAAYISNWQTECPSLTVWGADDSRAFVQHPAQAPYYTDERKMFLIQSGIIRELADAAPTIFVGRCADYVLREYKYHLNGWIHANEDSRALRLYDTYFIRTGSLSQKLKAVDQGRMAYYRWFTGKEWGKFADLSLDSGTLGIEGCSAAIVRSAQELLSHKETEERNAD